MARVHPSHMANKPSCSHSLYSLNDYYNMPHELCPVTLPYPSSQTPMIDCWFSPLAVGSPQ